MVLELGLGLGVGFLIGHTYKSMTARRLNSEERSNIRFAIAEEVLRGVSDGAEIVVTYEQLRAANSVILEFDAKLAKAGADLWDAQKALEAMTTIHQVPEVVLTPVAGASKKRATKVTGKGRKR